MSLFHRKALAGIGITAAAVASTALFSMPAQAASAGAAKVVGSSTVQFNALKGKSNSLVITISGRTVTLNDKVAIKAGKGCKAVKGDKTKVKCTTKKKTTKLSVALGDKNDYVGNKTSVYLLADGGSGNDTLTGGSAKDQLQGGSGNDKLYGKGGGDELFGLSGNDHIVGSTGNDKVDGGTGNDNIWGDSGNDELFGGTNTDKLVGGTGNDILDGHTGTDTIYGESGDDELYGWDGNDTLSGGTGDDVALGEKGTDTITGGDGHDGLGGGDGNDKIAGSSGDDLLVGEDIDDNYNPIGSDSATDKLDGGTNGADGDWCLVRAAGTTVNCELGEGTVGDLSRTAAPAAVADETLARLTAAQAKR
jgi:Ca2+-binding RTX toxin-like protein